MKIILALIVSLTFTIALQSQIMPEWATSYSVNYPESIEGSDMVTDKNGNVYVTGYKKDTANYFYTIVTLKYDPNGILQWTQSFDSLSYFSRIAVDNSCNVYLCCHWDKNLWAIKYNTLGILQWAKPYPSSDYSTWAWDIAVDDSSNAYITGESNGSKMTTLKYDSNGNLKWSALDSYPIMGSSFSSIALDNAQNVYVMGKGWDTLNSIIHCHVIKYSKNGAKKWTRNYYGSISPGHVNPVTIKYGNNGFIYLLTNANNTSIPDSEYNVVKYDTLGNLIWAFPYSLTSYYDEPKDLVIDKIGNVYVTGNIYPTGGSIDSIATIKISNSGTLKWKKTYSAGYSNFDEACGIEIDSLGFVYVGGRSGGSYQKENYVAIKYDSLGNTIWVGRYHNTNFSYDEAWSLSLDKNGNVFLSGTTREANTSGVLTIKFSNTVGIQELTNSPISLVNIYPNPSSGTLYFKSEQKKFEKGFIEIINYLGQTVLQSEFKNQIDVSELASGFYTLLIKDNSGSVITKKFVKE